MNWYRKSQVMSPPDEPSGESGDRPWPGYPYYIAIYYVGRFEGQYPPEIAAVPSMKKLWDKGKLGMGKKGKELRSESARDLQNQLRQRGINPNYDDVDLYVVFRPNSPRRKIRPMQLDRYAREER